ncbi:adenine deaminase [Clostridium taeniosporum]|uniref:Adenine deaminase n=1 Tax=Clostridium taeniosporum TaxID=394958 RepID=A0A1D7XHM9_9CLOT|nr:adenine deaminase [Clostridium taeniosporum]AOR22640.1 adenine deaminase [Clostridium taeniosporum]
MDKLKNNIDSALRNKQADFVLKNASIINVFTQTIEKGDIAINEDTIVGIGNYSGKKELDCSGYFISPGFIDSHVHVESSKVIPQIFSDILLKNGVTTCIADPHEIANVLGKEGIKFMLDDSEKSKISMFFMMPSCVPALTIEDNGAVLKAEDLSEFINNNKVLGLGEVMDVLSVIKYKNDIIDKLKLFNNKIIDGHCPIIDRYSLNAYMNCNVKTDHESTTSEEALEKVRNGMYIMLRQGSAARNLVKLLPAVNLKNFHRFLFCTDDKDIVDLIEKGSIDDSIRIAIENGMDPIMAITIATLNAAECYGLKKIGAIAPGYKADLVILENLENIKVNTVIKNGNIYIENEEIKFNDNIKSSMNIELIKEEIFKIKAPSNKVNVIKVIPKSIETKKVIREIEIENGYVNSDNLGDIQKIGVFERHKNTGKYSIGFIEGLGIKGCSIAQTIAHDSHNIIVIGNNDKDMEIAINTVIKMGGGMAIVSKGKIIEKLSLPIGGLMTYENPKFVSQKIKGLNLQCKEYGAKKDMDIFLTLGFMSLPVIPEIRITARGIFDFKENKFIDLFCI